MKHDLSEELAMEPDDSARFFSGAYRRMNWSMLVAAVIAAPFLFWGLGWKLGAGYCLGVPISFLNLHWLRRLVEHFTGLVVRSPEHSRATRMVAIFALRYVLIALGAYVIFVSSLLALYGFFVGLLLPVVAVFCEAFFEIAHSLRRA